MPDDHEHIRRDWRIPAPLWARVDPLGQESMQLRGVSALGVCLYHLSTRWPMEIAS